MIIKTKSPESDFTTENPAVRFLRKWLFPRRRGQEAIPEPSAEEGNPYLPRIREIMEAILEMRRISYGDFAPLLADGEDSGQCLSAAEALSPDLNRLVIATEKPAYFEAFAETMYEEQGLIVELFQKKGAIREALSDIRQPWNVMLDFEPAAAPGVEGDFGNRLYIPVFKRRWESIGNLDIAVPIGYNTVIIRNKAMPERQPELDRFERAFYED